MPQQWGHYLADDDDNDDDEKHKNTIVSMYIQTKML
jgi:hypothetical protein